MESPTLSRSPSATFGPSSRGRRSQTNIHHLSLAPLTPRYPVDLSDYDAYFDPTTDALHTSASLSKIFSVPSPGGILSPARSRANSKSRLKRKTKSTVSFQRSPDDVPSGALTSEGFGVKRQIRVRTEASWLVQTGLALTEGSRESKGQSWITKRDSSTSLHAPDDIVRSGRVTPRSRSMRRSRRGLSMTPAVVTPMEDAEPDWADSQTQAEIAAQFENELAEEFEDADMYGILDFDENFEDDDEEEVREAISNGKSWLDGMVDVFLKLEDDPPEDDIESARASRDCVSDVEPPPKAPRGVWDDVAWFGRLVARTVRS
ncbi:hypothetical protein R6Q59_010088 [Mikania micrantha]